MDQQRIIVEHFLKMRYKIKPVRRIAAEPAAHMVKQTTPCHLLQRLLHHLQDFLIAVSLIVFHKK